MPSVILHEKVSFALVSKNIAKLIAPTAVHLNLD
jgi:hypothetical protein